VGSAVSPASAVRCFLPAPFPRSAPHELVSWGAQFSQLQLACSCLRSLLPRAAPHELVSWGAQFRQLQLACSCLPSLLPRSAPHELVSWEAQFSQLQLACSCLPSLLPRSAPHELVSWGAQFRQLQLACSCLPSLLPRAAPHELVSWEAQSPSYGRPLLSSCSLPARRPPRARLVGSAVSPATAVRSLGTNNDTHMSPNLDNFPQDRAPMPPRAQRASPPQHGRLPAPRAELVGAVSATARGEDRARPACS